jgi:hypothetical protein
MRNWRASPLAEQFFGNDAGFDQQAAHLLARGALQIQRLLQLLLRDQPLLHQHITQT